MARNDISELARGPAKSGLRRPATAGERERRGAIPGSHLEGTPVLAFVAIAMLGSCGVVLAGEQRDGKPTDHAAGLAGTVRSSHALPLIFEPNLGQAAPEARFVARLGANTLLLTERGATMIRAGGRPLKMSLVGANKPEAIEGLEPSGGSSNYFHGADPRSWLSGIEHYRRVAYRAVYPGIDLVYHGDPKLLEYDFVVQAGADPSVIQLQFEGAESVEIDPLGNLVVHAAAGRLTQLAPKAYQQDRDRPIAVASRYRPVGRSGVRIEVAQYDQSMPLVIDPVVVFSTYLGGGLDEIAHGVVADGAGNVYVTGQTCSTDFPISMAFQPSNAGACDAFVSKLDATGSTLVYSTYLGGSGTDEGRGIAVASTGNVYLAGQTCSTDFPILNPVQGFYRGACDAFVTKLDPAGAALVYSTFLGGSGPDRAYRLAIDVPGNAYVIGQTSSSNFPLVVPLQPAPGGDIDAFVTKLSAGGSSLAYSTYLGGSGRDYGFGIAVDMAGAAHLTGRTASTDFPTRNPFQASNGGQYDAFVSKLHPSGTAFIYSTYMGGQLWDAGISVTSRSGRTYVTGYAASPDFPITGNAFQTVHGGDRDATVAILSQLGSLMFSSFLGGSAREHGNGLGLDAGGSMCLTGTTRSPDFPLVDPIQASFGGGLGDVFLARIKLGYTLTYSTYLGGSGDEEALGIAVQSSGRVLAAGVTDSSDFPTAGALQPANGGGRDVFVVAVE